MTNFGAPVGGMGVAFFRRGRGVVAGGKGQGPGVDRRAERRLVPDGQGSIGEAARWLAHNLAPPALSAIR